MQIELTTIRYNQQINLFQQIPQELIGAISQNSQKYTYPIVGFIPKIFPRKIKTKLEEEYQYYYDLFMKANTIINTQYSNDDLKVLTLLCVINSFMTKDNDNKEALDQLFNQLLSFDLTFVGSDELINFFKEEIIYKTLDYYSNFEEYYSNGTIEKLIDYLDPLTEKHNQFNPYQIKS